MSLDFDVFMVGPKRIPSAVLGFEEAVGPATWPPTTSTLISLETVTQGRVRVLNRRRMTARRADEAHRATTPLGLFFDLCFVVAVAQAATHLHHDLSDGHLSHALGNYLFAFFAIWWAWMNLTWFAAASAYDNDDDPYRLLTMMQIAGR